MASTTDTLTADRSAVPAPTDEATRPPGNRRAVLTWTAIVIMCVGVVALAVLAFKGGHDSQTPTGSYVGSDQHLLNMARDGEAHARDAGEAPAAESQPQAQPEGADDPAGSGAAVDPADPAGQSLGRAQTESYVDWLSDRAESSDQPLGRAQAEAYVEWLSDRAESGSTR
jgi:hypothetical protein